MQKLTTLMNYRQRGFTLVELLVTMSILATLIAVLLPNFLGAREKARDARKVEDLLAVKNALRMYYNDNQIYPAGVGTSDLSAQLSSYLPGIAAIEYAYFQMDSGEGFALCLGIDSGMGNEDIDSQARCGIGTVEVCGVGETVDGLYVVCGN